MNPRQPQTAEPGSRIMRVTAILGAAVIVLCAIPPALAGGAAGALDRFDSGFSIAYGRYLPAGGYNAVHFAEMNTRSTIGRLYFGSALRFAYGHVDGGAAFDYLRAYSIAQRIGWILKPRPMLRIIPFARGALDLDSAGGLNGVQALGLTFGSDLNDIKAGYEAGGGLEIQWAIGSRLVLAPFFDANYLHRAEETIGPNGQVNPVVYRDFTMLHYGAVADLRLIGPLGLFADVQADRIRGHGAALAYSGGVALRF